MEIVEGHVHLNQLVPDLRAADTDRVIATGVAAAVETLRWPAPVREEVPA